MKGDFFNGPDRAGKREMSFKTHEPGYKKSKTKNIARQSESTNLLLIFIFIIAEYVPQFSSSLLFS